MIHSTSSSIFAAFGVIVISIGFGLQLVALANPNLEAASGWLVLQWILDWIGY